MEKHVGELFGLASSSRLQRQINLIVLAHMVDIRFEAIARMKGLENLSLVDKTLILVIYNDLETKICLLPHHHFHLVTMFIDMIGSLFDFIIGREKILVNLGCSHQSVALFIDGDIDQIILSFLHAHLLLAEWAKQIFHQSPVEESTIFVDPCHFKPCEITYLGYRFLGCSYWAFVLIEIDKHFELVSYLGIFRHIACREKYLTFITSIKIQAEINGLDNRQRIIVTEFNLHLFLRFVVALLFVLPRCVDLLQRLHLPLVAPTVQQFRAVPTLRHADVWYGR